MGSIHKLSTAFVGVMILTGSLSGVRAGTGVYDKYLWETARATDIDAGRTAAMVAELRGETQRILDAGPLAPLRLSYADIPYEAYWIYYERGRVITTLAYAYPYLSAQQQESVKKYVHRLLSEPTHAPWQQGVKAATDGAPRSLHGREITQGRYPKAEDCPTIHVLYGLWLYGDRTGDWETIGLYWPAIRECYMDSVDTAVLLYGQMSAHIAVARMARRFGDDRTAEIASQKLARDLSMGLDPNLVEARQKNTRFRVFFEPRNRSRFMGQPWMFMDACPEICRFIHDNLKDQAISRIDLIKGIYPLWWLHQAPYFTRWTGDEGIGVTPELFGMVYPIERWVKQTPGEQLALYMRSMPTGIGDCYWLEGLVQTIEAFGTVRWVPVTGP
jgi:hypothetical protein